MFAGNFAPAGWMLCQGQVLSISEYDTLFNLIGTTYGGDGQETFNLPDLQGRIPMHVGTGYTLAANAGQETVILTLPQLPPHSHPAAADSTGGTSPDPNGRIWAADSTGALNQYVPVGSQTVAAMAATTQSTGNSEAHENRIPFLAVNFIISLFGIYPSPT